MKKIVLLSFLLIIHSVVAAQMTATEGDDKLKTYASFEMQEGQAICKSSLLLMGSRFEILVVAKDSAEGFSYIHKAVTEINRIEQLISSWNEASQTSQVNQQAGEKYVKVDGELFSLIQRSKAISDLTQGAFDISFGSIDDNLWKFDEHTNELPDSTTAKSLIRRINYKNILLRQSDTSVMLKERGMKIGFGAIGKGYAAEKVKALLKSYGVSSGVVNAGGDLVAWGKQPNGSDWTIGLANPNFKFQSFSWLSVSDMAVVTSGNYERYFEVNGIRYSHIIDPRTGYPAHGLKSVTVICPNAELADALATAVFILGKEVGLDLIEQLKGVESILITDTNQIHSSTGIQLERKKDK